MALNK